MRRNKSHLQRTSSCLLTLFNLTAVFGIALLVLGFLYIKDPKPVVSNHKGGIGEFFASVVAGMIEVARIGHVWVASLAGALTFGAMLALGVVWMPKLLVVHGLNETSANFGASLLWLGLAAGSAVIPHWFDVIRKRKMPIVLGNAVQLWLCLPSSISVAWARRLHWPCASSLASPTPPTCWHSARRPTS